MDSEDADKKQQQAPAGEYDYDYFGHAEGGDMEYQATVREASNHEYTENQPRMEQ